MSVGNAALWHAQLKTAAILSKALHLRHSFSSEMLLLKLCKNYQVACFNVRGIMYVADRSAETPAKTRAYCHLAICIYLLRR